MFWLFNFIFSYTASLFSVSSLTLLESCIYRGFVGACGWMVYILFYQGLNIHTIYSSFSVALHWV